MATINQVVIPLSKEYDDSAQIECKKQIEEKASSISVGGSGKSIFDKRTLEETPEITIEGVIETSESGVKYYFATLYLDNLPSELNYIKRDIVGIHNNGLEDYYFIRSSSIYENNVYDYACQYDDNTGNTALHILHGSHKANLSVLYSDFNKTNPFLKINLTYPEPTTETV